MGFSHAVFGGDNFQMFEGAHLHYIVLEGVDSPKPGQQFYIESRDALTSLLDEQSIELRIIRCDPDYREIGFAYLEDAPTSAAPHRLANSLRAKTKTNNEIDSAADLDCQFGSNPRWQDWMLAMKLSDWGLAGMTVPGLWALIFIARRKKKPKPPNGDCGSKKIPSLHGTMKRSQK